MGRRYNTPISGADGTAEQVRKTRVTLKVDVVMKEAADFVQI
jgi:hypothetical protein